MASSPNDIERSLLQKAVRRGYEALVEKTFKYLLNQGDKSWLKKRLAVIAYEDSLSYADQIYFDCTDHQLLKQYKALSRTIKNKNAAGLAGLASRLLQNEREVLSLLEPEDQMVVYRVATFQKDPVQYWKWIGAQDGYIANKQKVDAARDAVPKAIFPGDRLMMAAAALLYLADLIPEVEFIEPDNNSEFPWASIDKHCETGRAIYSNISEEIKLDYYKLTQIGFYFEGSNVNAMTPSPLWDAHKRYEMLRMGFTLEQAKEKWEKEIQPLIIQKTEDEVNLLRDRIENFKEEESPQLEFSFF